MVLTGIYQHGKSIPLSAYCYHYCFLYSLLKQIFLSMQPLQQREVYSVGLGDF